MLEKLIELILERKWKTIDKEDNWKEESAKFWIQQQQNSFTQVVGLTGGLKDISFDCHLKPLMIDAFKFKSKFKPSHDRRI